MNRTAFALCIAVFCLNSADCSASSAPAETVKRGDITYLQTPNGQTLYTFAHDITHSGQSTCYNQCAQAWPPFVALNGAKGDGQWKIISRKQGQPQWSYKGKPLYTFFKDTHPGEMSGQNYQGHAWQVATP